MLSLAVWLLTLTLSVRSQSESSEAGLTDPTQECTKYTYSLLDSKLSLFPGPWPVSPATILDGDTTAQNKYNEISGGIPDIQPKGTDTGDFSGVNYDSSDPDCWWSWHQCTTPKHDNLPDDIASIPEPMTLGYGFDDGPNCSHNAFYDFLESKNQKATMFYIGSNVLDWPLQAQRAIQDGHQVCVHTWSHKYMTALTNEEAFAELWYTMQLLQFVTGIVPDCWRPPYGDVDDRIRYIANALGLKTIIWQYDSFDWEVGTANVTTANVTQNYQDMMTRAENGTFTTQGAIFLMHELTNYTMQNVVDWYANFSSVFTHIVPIAVAMNDTNPTQFGNITYPTFDQYVSGTTNPTHGNLTLGTITEITSAGASASVATPSASGSSGSSGSGKGNAAVVGASMVGWGWMLVIALLSSAALL